VFAEAFTNVNNTASPQHRPSGNASRCLFANEEVIGEVVGYLRFASVQHAHSRASAHRAEVRAAHAWFETGIHFLCVVCR